MKQHCEKCSCEICQNGSTLVAYSQPTQALDLSHNTNMVSIFLTVNENFTEVLTNTVSKRLPLNHSSSFRHLKSCWKSKACRLCIESPIANWREWCQIANRLNLFQGALEPSSPSPPHFFFALFSFVMLLCFFLGC